MANQVNAVLATLVRVVLDSLSPDPVGALFSPIDRDTM
jgi:hypothetical protein